MTGLSGKMVFITLPDICFRGMEEENEKESISGDQLSADDGDGLLGRDPRRGKGESKAFY